MHALSGLFWQYVVYQLVMAEPVPGSVPMMTSEQ